MTMCSLPCSLHRFSLSFNLSACQYPKTLYVFTQDGARFRSLANYIQQMLIVRSERVAEGPF